MANALFDPKIFDPRIFDSSYYDYGMFDGNMFDPRIFDTKKQHVSPVVIPEQKIGSGGGGQTWVRRDKKYQGAKYQVVWKEIKEKEFPEEPKKVIEKIIKDVLIKAEKSNLSIKANEFQIYTTCNALVQFHKMAMVMNLKNINVETIQDYYSEEDIIKILMSLQ